MAKSRAQRKADRRKREEQLQQRARESQAKARGAAPAAVEEADVAEPEVGEPDFTVDEPEAVELLEAGARPAELGDVGPVDPVIESELVSAEPVKRSRREQRREAKERERRARESAKRREGGVADVKERGPVASFFVSVSRELQRVQWPDRDTLVQASAVTVLFVAIAAAYLGALDAAFNQLIRFIL
jgi:preprotein translocase SecE subunit